MMICKQTLMPLMALLVSVLLQLPSQVAANERIALVVGNGAYESVTRLDNPIADAKLMASVLTTQGFEVQLLIDTNQRELVKAISRFGRSLREAGEGATGLFYYAGHGVQSFGTNYLVPVDAALTDAADVGLVAVQAEAVLRQMSSAKNQTNIVILDACRNNPFEVLTDMDDNGLAEMKAPTGTFLAYATAPGGVALDGVGGNSPFTTALAKHIRKPGMPIERLFKAVRNDVLETTSGQQTPWDTSSLTHDFSFEPAKEISAEELEAQQLWLSVRLSRDPVQIMLFLRGYPNSAHVGEARALLAELMKVELGGGVQGEPATSAQTAVAPKSVEPNTEERTLFELARKTGLIADYQSYLEKFPIGVYSELAAIELSVLEANPPAPTTPTPTTPQNMNLAPPLEQVAKDEPAANTFGFVFPLTQDFALAPGFDVAAFAAENSPQFPPIEGLPDELWRGQSCSNCHNWSIDALCTQANTYTTANAERALSKQHPFGGQFKARLRDWAKGGCE